MEHYYSTTLKLMIPITLLLSLGLGSGRILEEMEGSNCWESLTQLRSCTPEVVLFFLNGETYLGPGCCRAIEIIQHDCWPQMLSSLGYTTEEGDVLRGYCDATSDVPPPPSAL